jgi:pimeloyl-ACP methyl ester carboxylesterase
LFAAALILAACGGDSATDPTRTGQRGDLVSTTAGPIYPASLAAIAIAAAGAGSVVPAKYDVQMFTITYRTIDVAGQSTIASGAVYLPVNPTGSVTLMSYSHGTAASKTAVPSNPQNQEGQSAGVLFGTPGNAIVMADYLGLGNSSGFHPYLHAATEASAGLDALRAAKRLAARQHVALDNRLFVFGYSQGGHAAMALAREIEQHASPEFTLTAAAPMSGPYDVFGTATAYMADSTPNTSASVYTLYTLASYNAIYHLADRPDQLFKPPYDALATSLIAGTIAGGGLSAGVAAFPAAMLQPPVLQVRNDPNGALAKALHDNDVYDWKPRAPMRLYYATADRDVPPQNALTAAARMQQLGANVQTVNLGPFSHTAAIVPAFVAMYVWFSGI